MGKKNNLSKKDQRQDAKIMALERKVAQLNLKTGRIMAVPKRAKKTGARPRNSAIRRKAHRDNSHLLRSDHGNVTSGLMDSVPTTSVLHRGQANISAGANDSFMYLGFMNGGCDTTVTSSATTKGTTISSIAGISYTFNATGGTNNYWCPNPLNNTNCKTSMQKAACPYNPTNSYKCKLNKASLHLSYAGSQTMMTATVYIFVDYHGDVVRNLTRSAIPQQGYNLGETYSLIFNHPRTIKVKVDSGSSIDYALSFPTAMLASCTMVDRSDLYVNDSTKTPLFGTYLGTGLLALPTANVVAQMDPLTNPDVFVYEPESANTTTSSVTGISANNPLVYVVASFPTAAQLTVNMAMDWEYHDESLYSVSKPSLCDTLTASALHTVVMAGHHEATTTPLHTKGLTFKDTVRKAMKAEHTAAAIAASPVGQAVIAAALA